MVKWTKVIKANEEHEQFDEPDRDYEIDHYIDLLINGNHKYSDKKEMLKNEESLLREWLNEYLEILEKEIYKHPMIEYTPLNEYDMGPDQQLYEDGFNEVEFLINAYEQWKAVKGI